MVGGWRGSAYSVDGVELLVWPDMRESRRIDVLVHDRSGLDEKVYQHEALGADLEGQTSTV